MLSILTTITILAHAFQPELNNKPSARSRTGARKGNNNSNNAQRRRLTTVAAAAATSRRTNYRRNPPSSSSRRAAHNRPSSAARSQRRQSSSGSVKSVCITAVGVDLGEVTAGAVSSSRPSVASSSGRRRPAARSSSGTRYVQRLLLKQRRPGFTSRNRGNSSRSYRRRRGAAGGVAKKNLNDPLSESNHEAFINAFAIPTHLYRYLAERHRIQPPFLNRNLSYLRPPSVPFSSGSPNRFPLSSKL